MKERIDGLVAAYEAGNVTRGEVLFTLATWAADFGARAVLDSLPGTYYTAFVTWVWLREGRDIHVIQSNATEEECRAWGAKAERGIAAILEVTG